MDVGIPIRRHLPFCVWGVIANLLWETLIKHRVVRYSLGYSRVYGLPKWLSGKEPNCHVGDLGSIPGLGRSPGGGNGNPLQDSCLENLLDRGAWWATVHGVAELDTTED